MNILTKLSFMKNGDKHPFLTFSSNEVLRDYFNLEKSEYESNNLFKNKIISIDNENYKVTSLDLLSTYDDNSSILNKGFDLSQVGEKLPYNLHINIHLDIVS